MRKLYILAVLVLFLGGYGLSVYRMETVLAEGKTILLALAPVDPRAPLMGDYMALRYVVNSDIRKALRGQSAAQSAGQKAAQMSAVNGTPEVGATGNGANGGGTDGSVSSPTAGAKSRNTHDESRNAEGVAVLRITNDPVPHAASFVRLDDGSPLQADEFLLAYRLRGYEVLTAAPAFYFQEGTAQQYTGAKFGVFKLAPDGKTLIVGLGDKCTLIK
ncbi:GDYXXLXY domain-containing protein [Desulfovibrio desulfuricans]|uniref:GDYXXLXY domain-containing protein n=1 Tax=Desulfovibrio desulfuricans TaxID=876 RepID=UPI001F2EBB76|nr:GDYXXLXY domain-containing protein [Desulfovibrio desulfuricans]UIB00754.1 GDYXXLXY domain-containing protein [Desulfovibrio desulfuricans]